MKIVTRVEKQVGETNNSVLIGGYEAIHGIPSKYKYQVGLDECKYVRVSRDELLSSMKSSRMFNNVVEKECKKFYLGLENTKAKLATSETLLMKKEIKVDQKKEVDTTQDKVIAIKNDRAGQISLGSFKGTSTELLELTSRLLKKQRGSKPFSGKEEIEDMAFVHSIGREISVAAPTVSTERPPHQKSSLLVKSPQRRPISHYPRPKSCALPRSQLLMTNPNEEISLSRPTPALEEDPTKKRPLTAFMKENSMGNYKSMEKVSELSRGPQSAHHNRSEELLDLPRPSSHRRVDNFLRNTISALKTITPKDIMGDVQGGQIHSNNSQDKGFGLRVMSARSIDDKKVSSTQASRAQMHKLKSSDWRVMSTNKILAMSEVAALCSSKERKTAQLFTQQSGDYTQRLRMQGQDRVLVIHKKGNENIRIQGHGISDGSTKHIIIDSPTDRDHKSATLEIRSIEGDGCCSPPLAASTKNVSPKKKPIIVRPVTAAQH